MTPASPLGRFARICRFVFLLVFICRGSSILAQNALPLRDEFWMDLEPIPGAQDPWPLPLEIAAERLAEEARFIYSGELWGFSFDWTPADKSRKVAESFHLVALRSIVPDDQRFTVEIPRRDSNRLYAYASYAPLASDLSNALSYARSPWRSAQGIGSKSFFAGYGGRRAAYEEAARSALLDLVRGMTQNRPKRVKGFMVFAGQPRIGLIDMNYQVQARFRILVTELAAYEAY